jgi:hypothetical protein
MKQFVLGFGIVASVWGLGIQGATANVSEEIDNGEAILLAKRSSCITWTEFVQELPTSGDAADNGGNMGNCHQNSRRAVFYCRTIIHWIAHTFSRSVLIALPMELMETTVPESPHLGEKSVTDWIDRCKNGKLLLVTWLTPTNGAIPYLNSIPHDRTFQREDGMTCLRTVCLYSGGLSHAELSKVLMPSASDSTPDSTPEIPPKQLTPIATGPTYSYPSSSEFATFKRNYKAEQPLSSVDRASRQSFQQSWQSKNPAIAPYIGTWKTADNQMLYVYPSTVTSRFCVVTQKDGKLSTGVGTSLNREARYDGTFGLFRIEGLSDAIAARSDRGQPLSAMYAAIGAPELTNDLKDELLQAKCLMALPTSTSPSQSIRR